MLDEDITIAVLMPKRKGGRKSKLKRGGEKPKRRLCKVRKTKENEL